MIAIWLTAGFLLSNFSKYWMSWCYQHSPKDWWSICPLVRLCEQTKLSLLGTWKYTTAPSASSPQWKINCLVWDHIFWSSWPLLLWRHWRCSRYCDIRVLCGNATQILWTRVTSPWDQSLINMVSVRWSNSPHTKGNKCNVAGNVSITSHFPRQQCSMASTLAWSLRLWLLFMGVSQKQSFHLSLET